MGREQVLSLFRRPYRSRRRPGTSLFDVFSMVSHFVNGNSYSGGFSAIIGAAVQLINSIGSRSSAFSIQKTLSKPTETRNFAFRCVLNGLTFCEWKLGFWRFLSNDWCCCATDKFNWVEIKCFLYSEDLIEADGDRELRFSMCCQWSHIL